MKIFLCLDNIVRMNILCKSVWENETVGGQWLNKYPQLAASGQLVGNSFKWKYWMEGKQACSDDASTFISVLSWWLAIL